MANLNNTQNYLARDYNTIRAELMNILKVNFPDQYQDFNSVGIGMSLVELLAYVSDLLGYQTDKKFNELFRDGVQERSAVFRMAKTFGYKPVGYRPALTVTDLFVEVPPTADGPDLDYLPLYRSGVQVKGASQVFETVSDCDFSSDFSDDGTANRKIEPIFNSNQDILRYRITKREKVKAGATTIWKKEISAEEASTSFFEIILPEKNVLEIVSVIVKPGINLLTPPTFTEFNDRAYKFWEVDELAQNKVFVDDDEQPTVNGTHIGKYITVPKRFTKEFMADGSCKVVFGAGTPDYNAYEYYISNLAITENSIDIGDIFNNDALGTKLPANSTVWFKYRVGGGTISNVGSNVLNEVGNIEAIIAGGDNSLVDAVVSSTRASNPFPAIGGADLQTVDEIKYNISGNFASQQRCVTLEDYIARSYQIPGRYGSAFRIYGKVEDNKVKLFIISKGADGKLISTSTSTIKNNLAEYLMPYRMINDFVEINDGKIINLEIEVDAYVDRIFNSNEVKLSIINAIKNYFDVNKWHFNQHIYISQLVDELREVPGVINIVDIRFFNLEGGEYSNTLISQAVFNRESIGNTGVYRTKIEPINNAIYSTPISIFEVRNPDFNIKCRVS